VAVFDLAGDELDEGSVAVLNTNSQYILTAKDTGANTVTLALDGLAAGSKTTGTAVGGKGIPAAWTLICAARRPRPERRPTSP
jgi:hypothetical protein